MNDEMKKSLAILGRAFAIAALSVFFAAGVDIWSIDGELVKAITSAGVVAVLWTVFSWLNPGDHRVGLGSEYHTVPDDIHDVFTDDK